MITIDDVLAKVKENNIGGEEVIRKAYLLAFGLHEGQFRQSGEPYISHPLYVAYILACTYNDVETICAALLHDTVEDTDITIEEIEREFGSDIAGLVDGVTKLKGMNFSSKSEKVDANTAKILKAINQDIRVIFIKCADRLHNMMTIGFKSEFKQRENALETIELYVPLAYRAGMYEIKKRLEALSFKVLNPVEYDDVLKKIKEYKDANADILEETINNIDSSLKDNGIKGRVTLRVKEVYSTYKKLNNYHRKFNNKDTNIVTLEAVHDLFAVKVVVDDYLDCYKALGLIHKECKVDNNRLKDYIAVPKTNLYQSFHSVFFANTCLVQAQIRTKEMDMIDTYGLPYYIYSSNKSYKEIEDDIKEKLQFCKDLAFLSEYSSRNESYVRRVKMELFADKVYVYDKIGRLHELPLGSTPIDLAYLLGDDVGNSLRSSVVNGIAVPLDYRLKNKDKVSLIKGGLPEDWWLDCVETTRAKKKIREYKQTCN